MSLFCVWLEDQENTAEAYVERLRRLGVRYSHQGTIDHAVTYLAEPDTPFSQSGLPVFFIIDLRLYVASGAGGLLGLRGRMDEQGFDFIDNHLRVAGSKWATNDVFVLTEREIDDALTARALASGVDSSQIFRKFSDGDLERFDAKLKQLIHNVRQGT